MDAEPDAAGHAAAARAHTECCRSLLSASDSRRTFSATNAELTRLHGLHRKHGNEYYHMLSTRAATTRAPCTRVAASRARAGMQA